MIFYSLWIDPLTLGYRSITAKQDIAVQVEAAAGGVFVTDDSGEMTRLIVTIR